MIVLLNPLYLFIERGFDSQPCLMKPEGIHSYVPPRVHIRPVGLPTSPMGVAQEQRAAAARRHRGLAFRRSTDGVLSGSPRFALRPRPWMGIRGSPRGMKLIPTEKK